MSWPPPDGRSASQFAPDQPAEYCLPNASSGSPDRALSGGFPLTEMRPGHGLADDFLSDRVVAPHPPLGHLEASTLPQHLAPTAAPAPASPPTTTFSAVSAHPAAVHRGPTPLPPISSLPTSHPLPPRTATSPSRTRTRARAPAPYPARPTKKGRKAVAKLKGVMKRPPLPPILRDDAGQPYIVCPVPDVFCTFVQNNDRRVDMGRHLDAHFGERIYFCGGLPVDEVPQELLIALPRHLAAVRTAANGVQYVGGCGSQCCRPDTLRKHINQGRCIANGEHLPYILRDSDDSDSQGGESS